MLGDFQKKVVGWAIVCLSVGVIGAFIVLVLKLLGDFLSEFSSVVWPVAIALIASFILRPLVDFVSAKLKVSAAFACVLTFVLLFALISAAAVFALPALISQISQLAGEIPDAVQSLTAHFAERFPDAKETIRVHAEEIKNALFGGASAGSVFAALKKILSTGWAATGGIVAVCSSVAAFAVAPIYLWYLLTAKFDFFARLEKNLDVLSPRARENSLYFVRRFSEIMTVFFRGQVLIAIIMGLMYGTGFWLAGVKFGFLIGFSTGILNIIPYLGTIVGLCAVLPVAALQTGGGLWLAALTLAIFVGVQMCEGYYLTPKIMGDRTGLHPCVIIFAVFFWGIALHGILGMILAIPLTAFAAVAWERVRSELARD